MKLFHVYSNSRMQDQKETWQAVKNLQNEGYNIEDILLDDNLGYEELLYSIWTKEDIILIEQDIVPTKDLMEDLINCNYGDGICYHYYGIGRLFFGVNYERKEVGMQRVDYMMYKGFGFTKILIKAQKLSNPNEWYHTSYQGISGWRWRLYINILPK